MSIPENYVPILIQAAVGLGFVLISLVASHYLGPRLNGGVKDDAFECGVEIEGDARTPFSVKYFLTAILFVLFDIEIVFFYPYAVNFRDFGLEGFLAVLTFVAVFFIGFFYVLKRGALDWDK
ncbi:NADH-quinone oxidoreductase subunit A [Riemerella anatipestifer]|uniref:NADH-quinone oxidoreductase subunit A n=2 Tax=Riemerella anatipestifer TaxID=34085 RepID=J9QYX3_RIEAN|nr:NADH-quinone oxidoreductase subunit A [Riemerella anatipestifer]AFR35750.1 NADH:ubiquinone oxidoreductase subunit 3 (chain A) [Riemerella anatipestifer RA-CH-1]AIH02799.1 NADH dehydrogenase subunit a [Riemerella anatipestifer CH3]AQY21582.1 NAD(P)H-quinone oxidoreductase subunit 3 [Riemerella anatipestifer]MCO4303073.1 NADH-quinone oxidoreductase subunit A [Riemerella anatipestifer]MCO7315809.1 NADH-quinone oxidoreductase subunit A [Riemerella anatipestifer]